MQILENSNNQSMKLFGNVEIVHYFVSLSLSVFHTVKNGLLMKIENTPFCEVPVG